MTYRLAADAVLLLHAVFILYVVAGGLALRWKPGLVWVHVPAALWGALIEFAGWICPLTPLENHFRRMGGEQGFEGGFIEHYLLPLVYPDWLTIESRYVLGGLVLAVNAAVYYWLWRQGTWKTK